MDRLFLTVLNMSLTGAFVIAAVCLARQFLKKAPKIISYVLWAVAGFRLVFPFSIESIFSLIPFNATPIPADIAMQPIPRIDSGIPIVNNAVSNVLPAATPYYSANPLQIGITVGAWVWFFGVAVMLIYGVVSFVILKHKMQKSLHVETNIYEADNIKSPFVLGILSPKIYLPAGLSEHERGYILLHEQTHIRRCDHLVKFAAYFILCLHWFNPLAWLAFWLMGADMEMSCDEQVMKEFGDDIVEDYSMSLVRIATGQRIVGGSPLAFGEGGMKERVKRILNFKKPSRVIIVLSIALVAVLSVGLAVDRANADNTSVGDNPLQRVFILENATDEQKFTRLLSVTLNPDGTAELATPPISSYMLVMPIFYTFADNELLIYYENGNEIARFEIAADGALIFRSSTVPLFADAGARYVSDAIPFVGYVDEITFENDDFTTGYLRLRGDTYASGITPFIRVRFEEGFTRSEVSLSELELDERIVVYHTAKGIAVRIATPLNTNPTSVASEQSLEEAMVIQDITPGGLSLSTRTAESTLYEAFFHIFEAVYDFDYALNHEIRYIAVDVTEVFGDIHESLLTVLRAWCDLKGYELLIDTYDGLVEAGLIVQPPDRSGFSDGLLFEFSDAEFDGETLTVSASKWRSPLGATGSEFTARFSDGNWVISTSIQGWWMS